MTSFLWFQNSIDQAVSYNKSTVVFKNLPVMTFLCILFWMYYCGISAYSENKKIQYQIIRKSEHGGTN